MGVVLVANVVDDDDDDDDGRSSSMINNELRLFYARTAGTKAESELMQSFVIISNLLMQNI